ncbi:MAG: hypothetical protein AB7P17_04120 [Nitrospirales bacterium]
MPIQPAHDRVKSSHHPHVKPMATLQPNRQTPLSPILHIAAHHTDSLE